MTLQCRHIPSLSPNIVHHAAARPPPPRAVPRAPPAPKLRCFRGYYRCHRGHRCRRDHWCRWDHRCRWDHSCRWDRSFRWDHRCRWDNSCRWDHRCHSCRWVRSCRWNHWCCWDHWSCCNYRCSCNYWCRRDHRCCLRRACPWAFPAAGGTKRLKVASSHTPLVISSLASCVSCEQAIGCLSDSVRRGAARTPAIETWLPSRAGILARGRHCLGNDPIDSWLCDIRHTCRLSRRNSCKILLGTPDGTVEEHLPALSHFDLETTVVTPLGAPAVHTGEIFQALLHAHAPARARHGVGAPIPGAGWCIDAAFVREEIRKHRVDHRDWPVIHHLHLGTRRGEAHGLLTCAHEDIIFSASTIAVSALCAARWSACL